MYTVTNSTEKIVFGAAGVEEVLQCVRMIITTKVGTVPMNREMGIDYSLLGEKTLNEIHKFESYVKERIQKYEPRAIVKDVKIEVTDSSDEPNIQVSLDVAL
jgi:phage baseplate assembly protein W